MYCRRNPRKPKSRRLLDIIVLEDAKFEENHELKFTVVFNHKRDESLRSYFRLQKICYGPFNTRNVCLSDFRFCFRFHELM